MNLIADRPAARPAPDRAAWQAAFSAGDMFDDQGPAAGWAASTRRTVCYDYGRWLMFLSQHESAALHQPPALRVTPARVGAYLDHLASQWARSGATAISAISRTPCASWCRARTGLGCGVSWRGWKRSGNHGRSCRAWPMAAAWKSWVTR